jgi:hypothetical protein
MRVAACAGGGDGGVAFADGVEHGLDLGDAEFVDRDGAEVAREVVADVALVAVQGGGFDLAAAVPLPQVVGGADRFGGGETGTDAPGDAVASGQRLAGSDLGELGVPAGEFEQAEGVVAFGGGVFAGGETAAAQLPASRAAGCGGDFQLVGPSSVRP